MTNVKEQCQEAHSVSSVLAQTSTEIKNAALLAMAETILANIPEITKKNNEDLELGKQKGLSNALLDRLRLTESRLHAMAESLFVIENLKDPINEIIAGWTIPNGLKISKVRVPFGVIGIIYEARPNVTADAIALCIKSGNCVVLRGSASAWNSNKIITNLLKTAAIEAGIPGESIQLLNDVTHKGVSEFIQMDKYLDLVIPRGGASLIDLVVNNSTVPSIETGVGNCHIYIDSDADLEIVTDIVINAKTQRPSVCNACETILVHNKLAETILPNLVNTLKTAGVEIRGCSKTQNLVSDIKLAKPEDWATEYLDLTLAVKIVEDIDAAIKHINEFGTLHTEAILSNNYQTIQKFTKAIDAAAVLVNTSTRFTDGGELGFGAEMGISTQKLHARGPLGLPELTTYKYIVEGNGQIRK